MDDTPDVAGAAQRIAVLADAVRDDQLADPTPCPDYAVRNMLGHLAGLSAAFRDAARKDLGETTGTNPQSAVPDIDGDWRTTLPAVLDELGAAWREPAAWEGMTQAGGVMLPAAQAGRVVLNELVIHGWDLARATGLPYQPATADLETSRAMLSAFAENPAASPFGPPVEVPSGAPLLDRVIGLSGRDPSWRPSPPER